ncbi:unnamed protein product [Ilex paraguariensis]|uniref:Cytochrome P450 n=1 Tax=Ilex paraguariensis TaxID=185542 RepID=A0ABC8TD96_9AQUA
MEIFTLRKLSASCVLLTLCIVLRVFYNIWWRPKSLEKLLKKQGIRGTSYKLFNGGMRESQRLIKEAWSKPMSLNHQIAPRVNPFFHQMVQKYGKISMSWIETRPG